MGYKLFLDDVRNPSDWMSRVAFDSSDRAAEDAKWSIARMVEDAMYLVIKYGCPEKMSLDHDLGDMLTGMDFVKWFVEYDMEHNIIPKGFTFAIHSANPVGAKNMQEYLDNYLYQKFLP